MEIPNYDFNKEKKIQTSKGCTSTCPNPISGC